MGWSFPEPLDVARPSTLPATLPLYMHPMPTDSPTVLPTKPWPGDRPMILASASVTRAAMLRAAGLAITTVPVPLDEAAIRDALAVDGASPRDIADALADQKAQKAARRAPSGALVLGADQVLDLDGKVLSKPQSPADAARQLAALSGRRHRLHSAAVAYDDGVPVWRHVSTATLSMRPLSPEFVATYVDRTWPAISASVGGYLVEAEGIRLFDTIDGDHFTILGLPLIPLLTWLGARGDIAT